MSNIEKSFFITVPSNTNYPGNSRSHFKVLLDTPLEFDGDYGVALTEITFPNTFDPFTQLKNRTFKLRDFGKEFSLTIANETFLTLEELIYNINQTIVNHRQMLNNLYPAFAELKLPYIQLRWLKPLRVVRIAEVKLDKNQDIKDKDKQVITFGGVLADILGLKSDTPYMSSVSGSEDLGINEPNFSFNEPILKVLMSGIEMEQVGGVRIPMLRYLTVYEPLNLYTHKQFDNYYYKRVMRNTFNELCFEILSANGKRAVFHSGGEVVVTLHFTPWHATF